MALTRIDPLVGGLGIDATGKFEVQANATVTVGDGTSTGNVIIGGSVGIGTTSRVTGITLGSANELLIVGSDGTSIISDSTLSIDTGSNYIGINQTSPEVTLHMTGEGAQTAQIRMEQYNDSADAPDVRTRRYRGTIASPAAVQSGDYLFRSNHEYYNGTSLLVGGAFAFDNTNNAARTQFSVAVDTDGTGADPVGNSGQFKIDGNDGGAITFNNAYKFPTSDGSANQILATDGSGALSFTGSPTFTGLTVDTNTLYVDAVNNRVGIGTSSPSQKLTIEGTDARIYLTGANTDIDMTGTADGQLSLDGNGYAFGIALNSSGANIYTNSASRDLIFGVNETEIMRITDSNVGIGTSSPTNALQLVGTAKASSQLYVGSNSDDNYSGGIQNLSNTSRSISIQADPTNSGASTILTFGIDGTERMRIDSSGNVGIGTTNPGDILDVVGGNIRIASTNEIRWVDSGTIRGTIEADGSGNLILGSAGGTERMRIDSSGNVGIGTTSPSTKLDITGSGAYSNRIIHVAGDINPTGYDSGTSGARIGFTYGATPVEVGGIRSGVTNGTAGSETAQLVFSTANSGTLSEKMRITSSGDVNVVTGKLQEGGNALIPAGSIIMYGAASAPGGWLLCEGGAVSRTTYATLFAVISTTYGTGDGSTTFNVPDFRDRAPYGASTFTLGTKTAGEVDASGQNSTGTGTSGSSGATTVASNTGSGGPTTHSVTTSTTNSTTDKDVTNSITVVTAVSDHAAHTHSIPSLTVNGHTHSVPALTVTHPGVAVKFIIKT